jgi:MFS transporter, MCT family, solute carrier family 16 (monocarboxylic acid transporters), member 10
MAFSQGIQCLGMWLVTSNVSVLIAFSSLYGFCSGVFIAVLPVIIAQISPIERLGGRLGAFYSVLALAQLMGSPVAGTLLKGQTADGYSGLIIFVVS